MKQKNGYLYVVTAKRVTALIEHLSATLVWGQRQTESLNRRSVKVRQFIINEMNIDKSELIIGSKPKKWFNGPHIHFHAATSWPWR